MLNEFQLVQKLCLFLLLMLLVLVLVLVDVLNRLDCQSAWLAASDWRMPFSSLPWQCFP